LIHFYKRGTTSGHLTRNLSTHLNLVMNKVPQLSKGKLDNSKLGAGTCVSIKMTGYWL